MPSKAPLLSLFAALALLTMVRQCCGHRTISSYPISDFHDRQIFRRAHGNGVVEDEERFPKFDTDIFGPSSGESFDSSRYHEDNESLATSDEANLLDVAHDLSPHVAKRRKGPTLSVVNPLEILRQRLMLDMARRRIHENQQQIVANAELLENLGKRNAPLYRQLPFPSAVQRGVDYQP